MENEKKLYDMLVAEKQFHGTYDEFHEGFKDPAKQSQLHKALAEKEYVTAPLDVWQAKWFGEGEKKKPEAERATPAVQQGAAISPASGQQSGTASTPTIEVLPPLPIGEQPAAPVKASPSELLAGLASKPTETLLFNYIYSFQPEKADGKKVTDASGNLAYMPEVYTPEMRNAVVSTLGKLNAIRIGSGDDMAKFAEAQRVVMEAAPAFAADNPLLPKATRDAFAATVSGMEKTNPKAYKEYTDKRISTEAAKKGEDEKTYRDNLMVQSIPLAFEGTIDGAAQASEATARIGYEKFKTSDPQKADALLAEAEQIRANRLGNLEEALSKAEETVAMLPGSDRGALDQVKALKQARLEFLNPAVQANKVYASMESEIKPVPGKTPKEKMWNYYQQLLQERKDLETAQPPSLLGDIAESTILGTGAVNARKNEIDRRIRALAPVVHLNQAPVQDDGFVENFWGSFGDSMLGGTLDSGTRMNKQEVSGHVLRAMQIAGVTEHDLQPGTLEMTRKQLEASGLSDPSYWGELAGNSAGLALPLMVSGAITGRLPTPKAIASRPLLNLVYGAAKSGASYEIAGEMFKDQEDELNFLGGLMGGIGKDVAGSAMGAMGKKAVGMVFGDKADDAAKAIMKYGAARAGSGVGETAEEFGQTIAQLAQSSSTFGEFQKKFGEQFPDWSAAMKFAASTMVMGMAMGGGNDVGNALGEEANRIVNALPVDEAVEVKAALQQLAEESTYAAEEFAKMAESMKGVFDKGVAEFAKPEEGGSAATALTEAPLEGFKQGIQPLAVTQEAIDAASQGTPKESIPQAIDAVSIQGMTAEQKYEAFDNAIKTTGIDVTQPLPDQTRQAMIEDITANPEDYRNGGLSTITYAIRLGAGLATAPETKAFSATPSAAEPTAPTPTVSPTLQSMIADIAGSNPDDVKLISEGFAGMFGDASSIDIDALLGNTTPEAQQQGDKPSAGQKTTKEAKPKTPKKIDNPKSIKDDAINEEVAPSEQQTKAAEQRVDKTVDAIVAKVESKTPAADRPKQKQVPAGTVITEYNKMDPGAYRLTEYRKDEKGNWQYRNAKVGTTPTTKKREYSADWQPEKDTPQFRDRIEKLAASPVRTDLKNAINELRDATRGMFRLGAISDPEQQALQYKRVIDATLNVGAQLIRTGVSDLKDWTEAMVSFAGEELRPMAQKLFEASQRRAAETAAAPTQQSPAVSAPPVAQAPQVAEAAQTQQVPPQQPVTPQAPSTRLTPAEGEGEVKERGVVTRLREKGLLDAETEAAMTESSKRYNVRDRDNVEKEVRDHIERYGIKGVKEAVMDITSNMPFDSRVTATKALMQHFKSVSSTSTDAEKANAIRQSAEMASFLAEFGTMLGQGVSALRGWLDGLDAFGPEFMVQFAEKYVKNVVTTSLNRTKVSDTMARDAITGGSRLAAQSAAESQQVQDAIDSMSASAPIMQNTKEQLAAKKAAALAKFRAATARLGGALRTGIDAGAALEATQALAEYGAALVAEGVVNFKAWAARIKKDLGDVSDAQLEEAWKTGTPDGTPEAISDRMRAATKLANMLKEPTSKTATDPMAQVARLVRDKVKERVPKKIRDKVSIVAEAVVNAEKYADAWRSALREVEQQIDASTASPEAKADKKNQMRDAVEEAIGKPFTDAQVKAAINASLKESGVTIKDLLADEDLASAQADKISEAVAALGVPQEAADRIAAAFKAEYESMLAKKRKEALIRTMGDAGKKYFGIVDNMGTANPSDADWRAMMSKKYGLPEMTEADVNDIIALAQKAAELPDNSHQRAKAAAKVLERISKINGIDRWGIFWDYFYANMLVGPTTHARNIGGNLYNMLSEGMVSGIEQTIATGDPSTIFTSFHTLFKGMVQMGKYSAYDTFVSGTASKGGKFENPGSLESITKDNSLSLRVLSNWKYVGRALAAEDAFFFHGFRLLRLSEIIRSDGHAQGLRGVKLREYVSNKLYGTDQQKEDARNQAEAEAKRFNLNKRESLIRYQEIMDQRLPKSWRDKAEEYGSFGTFNYAPKGFLGMVSEAITSFKEKQVGGRKAGRALNLIVPFTRVPANIMNQQLSYTPWGFVRLLKASKREEFGLNNRQERNRELIKAIVGTMWIGVIPMLLAAILSGEDDEGNPNFMVHGVGPADYAKRAFLASSGWRPGSVQIGTEWYPYEGTAVALPLAITGNVLDLIRYGKPKKEDMADHAMRVTATIMTTVFNRSFLTNMGDLMETLGKGEKAGEALKKLFVRTTSTIIPGYPIAKQATAMLDDTKYKARTFWQEYVSSIGGVRDWAGVKPELDPFGRPVILHGNEPWEVIVETIQKDPVAGPMIKNDLWYTAPGKTTVIDGIQVDDDELYKLTELAGKASLEEIKPQLPGWISALENATEEARPKKHEQIQDRIDAIRTKNITIAKQAVRQDRRVKKATSE